MLLIRRRTLHFLIYNQGNRLLANSRFLAGVTTCSWEPFSQFPAHLTEILVEHHLVLLAHELLSTFWEFSPPFPQIPGSGSTHIPLFQRGIPAPGWGCWCLENTQGQFFNKSLPSWQPCTHRLHSKPLATRFWGMEQCFVLIFY